MTDSIDSMRRDLVRERNAAKRAGPTASQDYLGSPVPVLGVPVPKIRSIATGFKKAHPGLEVQTLNRLVSELWKGSTFEEKATAATLAEAYLKILDEDSWTLLDQWAGEAAGWGLCDWLGLGPIARVAYRQPKRFGEILRWVQSPNPWRRRIAAYAVRNYVFAGELDKPFQLLERIVHDEEFWVQRAVGTWLRECWEKDRQRTEAFLRKHVRGLPKVVITVATERAPKAFREELRRDRDAHPRQEPQP